MRKYNEVIQELEKYNRPFKEKFFAFLIALLLSLLIISAPALILINLVIFKNYLKLIIFIGALLLIFEIFLIQLIYYVAITKGEVKQLWIVALLETLLPAILVLGAILLIFFIGVI